LGIVVGEAAELFLDVAAGVPGITMLVYNEDVICTPYWGWVSW